MAMGVSKEEASSCLRLTLGPETSGEDVDLAAAAVISCVERLTVAGVVSGVPAR
jgi:cysteine sulfinate desulfinase/cysteine desulfurase-like protein